MPVCTQSPLPPSAAGTIDLLSDCWLASSGLFHKWSHRIGPLAPSLGVVPSRFLRAAWGSGSCLCALSTAGICPPASCHGAAVNFGSKCADRCPVPWAECPRIDLQSHGFTFPPECWVFTSSLPHPLCVVWCQLSWCVWGGSQCGFGLRCPGDRGCWASLHGLKSHSDVFLGELRNFCPVLIGLSFI